MDEFRPDASFFEPRAGLGTFNHHKQHPYAHDVQPTPFGPHQHQYVPEYSMHQSLYEAPHHGHANQTIMHTSSYDLHHYHPQFASQWRPSSGFLFPVSGGDANTNRRYPDHSYSSWHTMPVEYVTDPQPTDVLSGRGGATNRYGRDCCCMLTFFLFCTHATPCAAAILAIERFDHSSRNINKII